MQSMALLAVLAAAPLPAPNPILEHLWEVKVAPGTNGRMAVGVCPDGASVVSNGEGRLVVLDPAGKITFDESFGELGHVSSLSCETDRILAAAADAFQVHVFTRGPAGPAFKVSHAVPLPAHRVTAASDGGYWILTHGGGPSQVHKISASGKLEHSTPLEDLGLNPHYAPVAPVLSQGGLLVVAPLHYAIHRIDRTGRVASTSAISSHGFTTRQPGLKSDEVMGVVPLPKGRFATHVSKATYVKPGVYQAGQWLEVLGPDFEIEKTGIRITRGSLRGADADGNLYFAAVGKDLQIFVVKARLVD